MKKILAYLGFFFVSLPLQSADPKAGAFICDFESADWQAQWNMGNPNLPRNLDLVPHFNRNAPNAGSPPPLSPNKSTSGNALAITLKQGTHYGADFGLDFLTHFGEEPEEAYMQYKLCFAPDFNEEAVQGGKLPGFGGVYSNDAGAAGKRVSGSDSWSARGAYWKPNAKGEIPIGFYVYHADMGSDFGDSWYFTRDLERGKWHEIRLYVKLNTPASILGGKGKNNGVLRAWLNGKQVFERRDIRFRDVAQLKVRSAWFHFYHGGGQPAAQDHRLWIDDVAIAPGRSS